MKNKGFTLVELLAVIVVLAIISIITIPMIGNVIEESKKKALEQSVNGLVEAARYYSIENDGTYEFLFDENKKGETINGKKLSYNGSIDAEGKLYLDKDGNISICVYNDKYYAYKNYNSGIVIGDRSKDNCDIGYDVISNKYIAFLESEGMNNNIYSKDEVNNLIASVDSKVTTNINEITNIKSTIETLQNSLNSYALQSSLNETNTNLNDLSSIVGNHTEAIDNLNSNLTNVGKEIILGITSSTGNLTLNDNLSNYRRIIIETHDDISSGYDSIKVRVESSIERFKSQNSSKKTIENRIISSSTSYINSVYFVSDTQVYVDRSFGSIHIYGMK